MINFIIDQIFAFFLHIKINTINLQYTTALPRPKPRNFISKYLAGIFASRPIKRLVGINLALSMAVVPIFTGTQQEVIYEPTPAYQPQDLVITDQYQSNLHTKARQFVLPVENLRYVGQRFSAGHPAYDLNSNIGDDVYAFSDGRVHKVEDGAFGLGRFIILDHGHGLTSVYAHLKSISVTPNQVVTTGEKIGEVGMTGNTTGPHLHFEIHDSGTYVNPGSYLGI